MKYCKKGKSLALSLVVLTLIFVSGCKSKKTISMGGGLKEKNHNEVINDVLDSEYKFETLTTKGSIEFKAGSASQKVPAVFKMIRDSVLQASVRIPILGGEAMRITFTPDSIVIVDRLKKRYAAERFKDSKTIADFDFNFYNLQALLTNKLFVPGNQTVASKDYSKYNVSVANDMYLLQTKGKGNLLYNFAVDGSNRISSTLIYNEKKSITLQWSYLDFINDSGQIYPTNMQAKVDIAKKRVDINIVYDKMDVDKEINIDNSISSKYSKVEISDLLGSYIKLK